MELVVTESSGGSQLGVWLVIGFLALPGELRSLPSKLRIF